MPYPVADNGIQYFEKIGVNFKGLQRSPFLVLYGEEVNALRQVE